MTAAGTICRTAHSSSNLARSQRIWSQWRSIALFVGAVAVAHIDTVPSCAAVYQVRTVARSEMHAPGTDRIFGSFGWGTIDDAGRVAFTAGLVQSPPSSDEGYWSEFNGVLTLAAREGSPAPGGGTYLFNSRLTDVAMPRAYSNGRVAFQRAFPSAVWSGIPGNTPRVFDNVTADTLAVNELGEMGFLSGSLLVAGAPGGLVSIAQGDPAPALGPGATYGNFSRDIVINDFGTLAFASGGTDRFAALFTGKLPNPTLIAAAGQPAPELPGLTLDSINDFSIANTGEVVFTAATMGNDGGGLWRSLGGATSLVAARNQPATEAGSGLTFRYLSNPVSNSQGVVAFRAALQGPGILPSRSNEDSVWALHNGQLKMIVNELRPIPELGLSFHTDSQLASDLRPIINDAGHIVIHATLLGQTTVQGLLTFDLSGNLTHTFLTGDQFEIAPGDLRTLVSADVAFDGFGTEPRGAPYGSNGQDGRESPLNNAGELVVRAFFNDGTRGLFVVTVPEPSGIALAILSLPCMAIPLARRLAAAVRAINKCKASRAVAETI